jgi:MarR family transcriptional regulator, organic hydroperoxide resistance regulator
MSARQKAAPATAARDAHKEAVDRIVQTAIYLQAESRRLAREQCARHGITATQLNVLKLLQHVGDLSLSQLSRQMAAKNSTITGIIDRMVAAELVTREQSASDRRVWNIRLTERGAELASSIEVAPWDLLRSALRALPADELDRLIHTLTRIAGHVEDAVAAAEAEGEPQP